MSNTQPLYILLKAIYDCQERPINYMYYELWASLDPNILEHPGSSRKSTTTRRLGKAPKGVLAHIGDGAGGNGVQDVARYLLDVLSDCELKDPTPDGETVNALGIVLDKAFKVCFDAVFYDSTIVYSPNKVIDALRTGSLLSFLWDHGFKEDFDRSLHDSFPDMGEGKFDTFWDEYDYLVETPFVPIEDRLLALDIEEQASELKACLVHHVALLMLASLFGPDSYYAQIRLAPPNLVPTDTAFLPGRTDSDRSVRLQPVVMIGNDASSYYTDISSERHVLSDQRGRYIMGRSPEVAEGDHPIRISSLLANVSRIQATIRRESGSWVILDGGPDGEGSSQGTLVVHVRGGSELLSCTETALNHGDIICLAPVFERTLAGNKGVPHRGVEGISFRFEIVS